MKLQLYPGGDARLMQARAIDPAIVATAFGTRTSTLALACHRGLRALSLATLEFSVGKSFELDRRIRRYIFAIWSASGEYQPHRGLAKIPESTIGISYIYGMKNCRKPSRELRKPGCLPGSTAETPIFRPAICAHLGSAFLCQLLYLSLPCNFCCSS